MTTVILAEKEDQGRKYMTYLGIKHGLKATMASGSTSLDKNTTVVCASGHLIELEEPEYYDQAYKDRDNMKILPLIPSKFAYEVSPDTKFLFYQAKKELRKADTIIVATDNDFEGGAIAFNILWLSGILKLNKRILRSYPTAMEKKAILRQFQKNHLKPIDETWRQASAAIARSRSDWLIGMNLSRLYTHELYELGIPGNFAVGRVITATLSLICSWYEQISNFHEEPIYEMEGAIPGKDEPIILKSKVRIVGDGKHDAKQEYLKLLKKHRLLQKKMPGTVSQVVSETKQTTPPILMTKGDLYKEMKQVYGWPQKKAEDTMQINYEQGYQTYPRTDSGLIDEEEYDYMAKLFDQYLHAVGWDNKFKRYDMPDKWKKKYLIDSSSDSSAHLAIIPTEKIMPTPNEERDLIEKYAKLRKKAEEQKRLAKSSEGKKQAEELIRKYTYTPLTEAQRQMYEVVVKRSLSLFQPPYEYVSNKLVVDINGIDFSVQNTSKITDGWKAILPQSKKKRKKSGLTLGFDYRKAFKVGQQLTVTMHTAVGKTVPPKPLTVSQIFYKGGLMEKAYKYVENKEYAKILRSVKGLGTSATRDTALTSLQPKKYITVGKNDVITVTGNGWLINWLLKGMPVSSPVLTAKWEEEYQRIADGKDNSNLLIEATAKMINDQFNDFDKHWQPDKIKAFYKKVQGQFLKAVSFGKCPQCNKGDVVFIADKKNKGKWNRYSCTNKDCNFVIWSKFYNKKFTDNDIKKLIAGEKTHLLKGVKSKKGKKFDCWVKLKYDDKKQALVPQMIFPTRKMYAKDFNGRYHRTN